MLYVASLVPLTLAALLCAGVLAPEPWLTRYRRGRAELFRWALLAFLAALVLTAVNYIALAIDALGRDSPFSG